jgi:hypothetical protein
LLQAPFGLVAHELRKQAQHWRQATSKEPQLQGLHAAVLIAQVKSVLWAIHLDTEVPKRQLHLKQLSRNASTSKRLRM